MARIVTAQAVRDEYADIARVYDRQWGGISRAVRNWVMDRFPPGQPAGARVLDAGCGTGHMLAAIADEWPLHRPDGIDICPAMLALAAQKAPKAALIEADLAYRELPARTYDTVLSLNVLRHINDAAAHLSALAECCTLGGTLFLCDHAVEGVSMRLAEKHWRRFGQAHARGFTVAEMKTMLAALPVDVIDHAVLRPDIFWRLQIYQLRRRAD